MSERNLEIVRQSLAAWNAGDLDRVSEFMDDEVELVPMRSLLDGRPYHGHDGLRQFAADWSEEWEGPRVEVSELREAGDSVLVLGTFHATGAASGVEFSSPAAWLSDLRDGKIVRMKAFSTQEEALRAVGLSA